MKTETIKLSVLVSTFLVLSACSKGTESKTPGGEDLIAGNIVGGSLASDTFQKENGLVALIIETADGQGLCTGTLIAKRIVLTAAHCLDSSSSEIKSIAVVFAQDVSKAKEENVRFGVRGKVHELFLSSAGGQGAWNDIALLKLSEDAPADFKLANLPSVVLAPLKPKTSLIQAGFGKTQASRNSTTDTSGVLKQVSGIEVIKLINDGKEMHLRENGKGSCNGDSGGPAFVRSASGKLIQVGVNSRGTDPASCIGVGVFTTVAPHLAWIKTNSDLLMAEVAEPAPVAAAPAPVAAEPTPAPTSPTPAPGSI